MTMTSYNIQQYWRKKKVGGNGEVKIRVHTSRGLIFTTSTLFPALDLDLNLVRFIFFFGGVSSDPLSSPTNLHVALAGETVGGGDSAVEKCGRTSSSVESSLYGSTSSCCCCRCRDELAPRLGIEV